MRRTQVVLLAPLAVLTLSASSCAPTAKLLAEPGKLACPGDTVKLTWDGADANGPVTISAMPALAALPLTGDADGSTDVSISVSTRFEASQNSSNTGSAFVEVPLSPNTVAVTYDISPVCNPGAPPYWPLNTPALMTLPSPRAIVQVVTDPSFQVRATHSGIFDVIPPGGSTRAFASTSVVADWVFADPLLAVACRDRGDTSPKIGGIDPASLSNLSVTIEATCP